MCMTRSPLGKTLLAAALCLSSIVRAEPTVGNYELIDKERVDRTSYRYTFRAALNQVEDALYDASAALVSSSPNTTVVDGDLSFGDVAAGQSAVSSDTFAIVQDRRHPFDEGALEWEVTATPVIWSETASAGSTNAITGWDDVSPVRDTAYGDTYTYVKNEQVAAVISGIQGGNNSVGTFHPGYVADFVARDINVESLDWTQFLLADSMLGSWNYPDNRIAFTEVETVGDTVVASGNWVGNSDIQASASYSIIPGAPVLKVQLTLDNTGDSNFEGFFQYQLDPDASGNQNAFIPGLGWGQDFATSGWSGNYIYNGPAAGPSPVPAHGIAWYTDSPTGLIGPGYIFGAWFDASVAAGESREITFYHITDTAAEGDAVQENVAYWARELVNLDDELAAFETIHGTVRDVLSTELLPGIDVIVRNTSAEEVATTSTNAHGEYEVLVPRDVYTLTTSSLGYDFASRSVDLNAGRAQLDFELNPVTVWAGAGKRLNGSLVEASKEAVVMENQALALALAVTVEDGQLPGATRGKPLDFARQGNSDDIDWINLPYLSLDRPTGTEAWQVTTVQSDTVVVEELTESLAIVRVTGVYSEVPGVSVETVFSLRAGDSFVEVQTTIHNGSGAFQGLWLGDVIDVDSSGQTSYVPGIGLLSNGYSSPQEFSPAAPWIAQYGGVNPQAIGLIYEGDFANSFVAYGNTSWLQSQAQVSLEAGASYTLRRYLVNADTEGFLEKAEAIQDAYQRLTGLETRFELSTDSAAPGDSVTATLTLSNNGSGNLRDLTATLSLPGLLGTQDATERALPAIAVGGEITASWEIDVESGGQGEISVQVEGENVGLELSRSLFSNGPGWFPGDNHSHSRYSDGSGTIEENYASARNKGLTFVTSTDHNTLAQRDDVYTYSTPKFLGLLGEEVTSSYGHSLAYNTFELIDWRLPPQAMIDSARAANGGQGMLYIAHPYYPGLEWDDWTVTNYNGIEVWNGFYAPTHPVNTQAFEKWDEFNLLGYHINGIANSDAHNTSKIGDPMIRAYLGDFSRESIIEVIRNGNFYGTNGPELDFAVNGVMMGGDAWITTAGETITISASASHDENIISVRLIKNGEEFQSWTPGQVTWAETLSDSAVTGDFYRLEVQTLDGGYAFSNPVWIAR